MCALRSSRRSRLEVLRELAHALVTTRGLEDLFAQIVESIGEVMEFYDCVLYIWDARSERLVQRAAHGPKVDRDSDGNLRNPIELALGEGIVGHVAAMRESEVVADTRLDPRYICDLEENRSEITVPICFRDQLVGVIDAEAREPNAFSEEDLVLLTHFADLCAPAIVNSERLVVERRRAASALRESEQRYRAIVELARDPVYTADRSGRITYANPAAVALFGGMYGGLVDETLLQLVPITARDEVVELLERLASGEGDGFVVELPMQSDGSIRWTEQRINRIEVEGTYYGFQSVVRDVTERRQLEARLQHLANHDPLTGLFNRHRFLQELDAHFTRSRELPMPSALLWIDLDRFKDINDSEGHAAGDEVLLAVAETLREIRRASDLLARFGGDEFALLLRDADRDRALVAAERVLDALRGRSVALGTGRLQISASIGIALIPEHGDRVDEVLARADLAMYDAKDEGRNGVRVFTEDQFRAEPTLQVSWGQRIRKALAEDRFLLYVQPILGLTGEPERRYEVLVRLIEGGELVHPGAFLQIAERYGLVTEIDRAVVGRSIDALSRITDDGVVLEVNLSGKSLSDPVLLPFIRERIVAYDLDPARLVLEITETAALSDANRAHRFIESLRAIGCRFALDDFGVGFSSFYHLKHLAIDYLKIDGSFVRDIASDPVDRHLVGAIVELGRALRKKTIAEYVESEEALEVVTELGVDYAQGFVIGRPEPIESVFPECGGQAELRRTGPSDYGSSEKNSG